MTFKEKLQRRARKSVAQKALVKFSPYDIILAPVLTEKTYKQQEVANNMFSRYIVMLIKMILMLLFNIFIR